MVTVSVNDKKSRGGVKHCIAPLRSMFRRRQTPLYFSGSIDEVVNISVMSQMSDENSLTKTTDCKETDDMVFSELNVACDNIRNDSVGGDVEIVRTMSNEMADNSELTEDAKDVTEEHVLSCVESESMESTFSLESIDDIDNSIECIEEIEEPIDYNEEDFVPQCETMEEHFGYIKNDTTNSIICEDVAVDNHPSIVPREGRTSASRSPLFRCLGIPIHLLFCKIYVYASNIAMRKVKETMRKDLKLLELMNNTENQNNSNNDINEEEVVVVASSSSYEDITEVKTTTKLSGDENQCDVQNYGPLLTPRNEDIVMSPMPSINSLKRCEEEMNTPSFLHVAKMLLQISEDLKLQSKKIKLLKRQMLHKSCVRILARD